MAITSAGVGSGLDVEGIVSKLVQIESRQLNSLESKKSTYQAQLSAYGKLSSAVSAFQSAMGNLDNLSDFKLFSGVSADEDVYTATTSSLASTGTYNVQVDRLAQAHKISSKVFADTDTTTVGGADLTMTIGTESFTITGAGSLTLDGLRDAINNASDNVGLTASIVSEDATNNYLVLTSDSTGEANAISLSGTAADAGNLGPTDINVVSELDAQLVIDNTFTITRSTNTISDAISGVTLNLKNTSVGNVNFKVERDTEGVSTKVQEFVDKYNELKDTMNSLRANELSGDSILLSIENNLKSVFNTPPSSLNSSFNYLVEIGVAFDKTGKLTLDADDLNSAVASDFDGLAELFSNDNQGYAFRLEAAAGALLESNGLVDAREDGINASINSTESRIDRESYRLQLVEERLRRQFTALDSLVSSLSNTGNFLQTQLSQLANLNN